MAAQNKAIIMNDASDAGDDMHTNSMFFFFSFAYSHVIICFRYTIQSPSNNGEHTQRTHTQQQNFKRQQQPIE